MALVKSDGTLLAKSPGGTVHEAVTETDPKIKVLIPVYEMTPYDNVNYPTQERQLAFRQGQIIRQSEWDAKFTAPTIDTVTPNSVAAAGGTSVTITGSNFTTGTTVGFGGTAGTSVSVKNDGKLTVTVPAKTAGTYDVTVVTAAATATKTGGITYT